MPHEPELFEYDFGKKLIWPKPELSGFELLRWEADLRQRLAALPEHARPEMGRSDHYAKGLHTLAFALRECLFKVMVLQETLYGSPGAGSAGAALAKVRGESPDAQ